jgi:hypothetical protein
MGARVMDAIRRSIPLPQAMAPGRPQPPADEVAEETLVTLWEHLLEPAGDPGSPAHRFANSDQTVMIVGLLQHRG